MPLLSAGLCLAARIAVWDEQEVLLLLWRPSQHLLPLPAPPAGMLSGGYRFAATAELQTALR